MVDYKYSGLFQNDSVNKQMLITTSYGGKIEIKNENLHSQQFELTESLCSESQLRFGACEANSIKFRVSNIFTPLKGKEICAFFTSIGGKADSSFNIGAYKVDSDVPTADKKFRDVTAYDSMYDILNADVTDWYNYVLPDKDSSITLREFRHKFVNEEFGIEEKEIELPNDSMIIKRTIEPEQLSGKDVITAICEINGCFGDIGRDGEFRYVFLQKNIQGLYPAEDLYPSDDLYPRTPNSERIGKSSYISCKYEDYLVQKIDKLQIRQEENDIGVVVGSGGNTYIIENNFLVYGKSESELKKIANNIFSVISEIAYRPFSAECFGNPCFQVGDPIRILTSNDIVETYILQRTMKGIQALKDSFSADGEERYLDNVNSVQKSIAQLKGKTNTLERTVEKTQSTIADVEENLQSQITQTAKEVSAKVAKGEVSAEISIELGKIKLEGNRISIISDFFELTEEGKIKAVDGLFSGRVEGSVIVANGKVTRKASDYTESDQERIKNIVLGTVSPTKQDFIKLDINCDGVIDILDATLVKRLLSGIVDELVYDIEIEISTKNGGVLISTGGITIGNTGATIPNLFTDKSVSRSYCTIDDTGAEYSGATGSFTTANGKNIQVINGIITSIS